MIPILTLLMVVTLSLVVTRVATVAFVHTGISPDMAKLQAISSFTGTGFATEESEMIVRHPVRRRILVVLMILGNAGLVTAVSSLILGFVGAGTMQVGLRHFGILAGGLLLLVLLARSQAVERWLRRLIEWGLKRFTELDVADYVSLLQITEDYMVSEVEVEPAMWIAKRPLKELGLPGRGIIILGVHRMEGRYEGIPTGETQLLPGDRILLYGKGERIRRIVARTSPQPFLDLTREPFTPGTAGPGAGAEAGADPAAGTGEEGDRG